MKDVLKKNSKVLFFLFLISSFLALGFIFTKGVSAYTSETMPEGYRLLTANDVGKTFGVELESTVYFDTSVDVPSYSTSPFYLTNFLYYKQDGRVYAYYINNSYIGFAGAYITSESYTFTTNLEITSYDTNYQWNNWFYVKDIQSSSIPPDVPQNTMRFSTAYLPSKIIYDYSVEIEPYDFSSSLYIPKFNLLNDYDDIVTYQCSLGQGDFQNYDVIFSGELSPNHRLNYTYTNLNLADSYLDIYYQDIILPVYEFSDSEGVETSWDNYIPDLYIYKDSLTYDTLLYNIIFADIELVGYNRQTLESQVLTLSINVPQPDDSNFYSYYSTDTDSYTCFYLSRIIGDYVSSELYPYAEDNYVDLGLELNYISNLKIGLSNVGVSSSDNSYSFGFTYNFPTTYSLEDWISSDNMFNDFSPIEPIEMSNWLMTSIGAFMDAELFPGFAIGGIFAVLVAFPIAIWFLKIVLGG